MSGKKSFWGSTAVKVIVLICGAAITITAIIAITTSPAKHTSRHLPKPAAVTLAAAPAAAAPAAPAAAKPESKMAAAFTRFFRHQAADGMTAWTATGTEARNQAILIKARGDAYPHRDAALPADSAALAASARHGLAHPAPRDTAGWNTLMHDELTLARELPDPYQGNAATALAPVILRAYLTFTTATA